MRTAHGPAMLVHLVHRAAALVARTVLVLLRTALHLAAAVMATDLVPVVIKQPHLILIQARFTIHNTHPDLISDHLMHPGNQALRHHHHHHRLLFHHQLLPHLPRHPHHLCNHPLPPPRHHHHYHLLSHSLHRRILQLIITHKPFTNPVSIPYQVHHWVNHI